MLSLDATSSCGALVCGSVFSVDNCSAGKPSQNIEDTEVPSRKALGRPKEARLGTIRAGTPVMSWRASRSSTWAISEIPHVIVQTIVLAKIGVAAKRVAITETLRICLIGDLFT